MSAPVTHRTLVGEWELCANAEPCELLFHFPGTTPEEMAGVPLRALLPLLEVIDPPTEVDEDGWKIWKVKQPPVFGYEHPVPHRDYDLPAAIDPSGIMMWQQNGLLHREHDRPAMVLPTGEMRWYRHGELHRDNDQPATIQPNGTREWWFEGAAHRDRNLGPAIIGSPERTGATSWQIVFMEHGEVLKMAYTSGPVPRPEQLEYQHWVM